MNWNQLGQVPVPRGFRSPKGHEASSITKVCGGEYELVVVEIVVNELVVVVVDMDDVEEVVVVDELDGPIVEA